MPPSHPNLLLERAKSYLSTVYSSSFTGHRTKNMESLEKYNKCDFAQVYKVSYVYPKVYSSRIKLIYKAWYCVCTNGM